MVYIAPKESNGEGDVWVKIWEDGYTDGKWGVDNFITNKGLITVTLPDLAAGEYLIRPELIGLHEGNREGGAQFYNGCGQLKITGSGSATLPAGVDITKAYSASDAGVLVDIYSGLTSYEIPGPAVWDGASGAGSGSGSGNESSPAPATSATPVASSTPSATASPVAEEAPAQTSAAAPAPSAGGNTGSGSLPESFTLEQFISWLQESAGSSTKKARRHARAFL
ncbi:hypothetical protein BS50DRAFT_598443 [Corynespora cassiicola Philippines]|uniref:AA9 family lytic polysaccharide monooxygenase n=1 Tax=Corynespora cassiicola Philippines TaxID=1448308 RepID=A0A2T2P222_CORCC|nr:hypothetical protein BS50DRAFT_598443 [Corynespora cassiicola Philippines]